MSQVKNLFIEVNGRINIDVLIFCNGLRQSIFSWGKKEFSFLDERERPPSYIEQSKQQEASPENNPIVLDFMGTKA